MSKKTKAQELQEQLTWSAPHIGKDAPDHKEKAFKYCEGYKQFLNAGKTERECVKEAVHMLKKAGYKPFDRTNCSINLLFQETINHLSLKNSGVINY